MKSLLKLHSLTLGGLFLAANCGLLIYLAAGDIKYWAEINWMDVLGEGGAGAIWFGWLIMLLRARPAGRVTRLLAIGLCCLTFSMWMDMLDEFIRLPPEAVWDNWLETAPMPVGMILLTLGVYHLHREQQAISVQMSKREQLFREHRLFDNLTSLSGAQYLRQHLRQALGQAKSEQRPLSLIAIDLDDFNQINQRYGQEEGDLVLQVVAQLLLFNLRHQDMLCRLAGDRFVAVLPDTGESQAQVMAEDMRQSIASLAHRTQHYGERLHLQATAAAVMALDEDEAQLLKRLNIALAQAKPRLVRSA
ncbi:GGDEF domain-containing protein [Pseudomonas daroniae]|uniref:diguanylate cyclase n=1 Tax=Phytopseudomonas daroniae TaxID=2487519 RepID=A0A4Q9QLH5_9GAMM|nr:MULTISPECIES: GGDEF domain-containing protein [Pseudomonas]TBU73341.1 GGDEF domain-containing protein [Pseudomonas daroniae]TBU79839.1 GGDEF domain-containing protein [Pseudomonas daroniae]TBU82442.1 GGDEF domain-containing protein [Pseudomonas sp. FRB 228]TBU91845.1 GGDEF domain-containing protein [Pseudomonas daroniae]